MFYVLTLFAALATAQLPSAPSLTPIPSYKGCPPDGPLLPRPTDLSQSAPFFAATDNLTSVFDAAVSGEIKAGWAVNNVSLSVAVVSPYSGQAPLWEYHHRATANTNGTAHVSGDSQYLVGSVSKVLSDLVLLKSGVDIQSRVTDFFPELDGPESLIDWNEVTLEALAEHLAGIPPNSVYEFYFLQPLYESLGYPHLTPAEYPSCGVTGLNGSCSSEQIISGLLNMAPVVPLNSKPVYSQLSFTLFSLCLQKATGKNYTQLLDETVIQPLNLKNTGLSPGNSEKAVIPPGDSSWGSGYGFNAPGGGLYSSTNDLSIVLNSILNHTILSAPAKVRKWLKPSSMTSSPNTLVGMPWEILRTSALTPTYPHTIDIYGKSGGAAGYMSQIAVVDQYGVGVVILTAGPVDSLSIIYRAVTGMIMPAVEEETREQSKRFTGNWTTHANANSSGAGANKSGSPTHLSLTLDNGPGLNLTALTHNSTSILTALHTIFTITYTSLGFGIISSEFRIYPTEIETPVLAEEATSLLFDAGYTATDIESKKTGLIRQEWRINFDVIPLDGKAMSDLPGQEGMDAYCASWQVVDWMRYGGEAMDKVVFVVESGRVVGVEVPGLRGGLSVRA